MKARSRRTPEGELYHRLVHEVFRINGQLLAAGDWLTQGLNLSGALWQVLDEIAEAPLSIAQIARNMWLTRQSVRRTAIVLEGRGFVEFRENPNHRRARLVAMTPKGRDVLDRVTAMETGRSNDVGSDIGAQKLAEAIGTLSSLRELLQQRMIAAKVQKQDVGTRSRGDVAV
jgi:DNA-binding MarR family transcriptional regulator